MIATMSRKVARIVKGATVAISLVGLVSSPVTAQIRTVDPNSAIDSDLAPPPSTYNGGSTSPQPVDRSVYDSTGDTRNRNNETATGDRVAADTPPAAPVPGESYQEDDLIGAAEGVFGKGAEGLAGIIEKILKEQGRPNAYIAGREAAGAFVVGLRYGSGTLNHKVEGKRQVYWTGPSVGFDFGGNAGNTFVLVYNLYDTQDLYHRFPAAEGTAYLVGGFTASYMRWGSVVIIPIRMGVGYRLGINAGYMKFTEKRNWLPF